MTLSHLADRLSLPILSPRGLAPHVIFRGPLMSFHFLLDERRVGHTFDVMPDAGAFITMDGLVVERGEMGGVMIRDAGLAGDGRIEGVA